MKKLMTYLLRNRFMSLTLALGLLSTLLPAASRAGRIGVLAAAGEPILSSQSSSIPSQAPPTSEQAREAYGKIGMSFELNQGQTDPAVNFLARGAGYTLFLTPGEAVFVLARQKSEPMGGATLSRTGPALAGGTAQPVAASEPPLVLRMKLEGANPQPAAEGLEQLPGIVNYFIGNEPEKWHTDIPTFGRVRYAGVYEGVDLVYYGNQRQLEYDFVVNPGADYKQIALSFEGANKLEVDATSGDLLLQVGESTIRQRKPVVYQEVNGTRQEIQSGYEQKGAGQIGITVGEYDARRPLIIDPVLAYSTYLGGASTDQGNAIAVDSAGNAYVTGETDSENFPTANAFQGVYRRGFDSFVTKFNAAGSVLLYSTYLGGNGFDQGRGIAVDRAGNAYVTGETSSSNFPTANAFQVFPAGGVYDAFVTKLNASGSALVYSTYLGGSETEIGRGIAVDSAGNAYVTGYTNSPNFPTANAFQGTFGGGFCGTNCVPDDAFVTKLNASGSALVYSTYLGTSMRDEAFGIAVDSAGNAYITGLTDSDNFPTANAFQSAYRGGTDAFVTKLNAAGSALVYSTYLGGFNGEIATGIAVDSAGNAYVTGFTASANFPTANAIQNIHGAGTNTLDAFVTKLNAAGSDLVYSTYLGGSGDDVGHGIAVDSAGNAYVTGETKSANFPTADAIQSTYGGGSYNDGFVTKLNASGSALVYSTYLGGNGADLGFGIAVDSAGNAYVTGVTDSTDFATVNPFQGTKSGFLEGFVTKLGSYVITGRVIDAAGNGISGVTVTLSGANSALTTTDAGGNFFFLSTTPFGEFNITPFKAGFTFSPSSSYISNLYSNRDLIFIGAAPAPTPTPTPTATATATPTATATATPTATATATPTATATATPTATATATPTATPTVTPKPASQPVNLSTRMRVQTGDNIGIGGFIITGTVPKHVLIRAIGPSLTRFGLTGVLADPVLELHGPSSFQTLTNDNWRDSQKVQIEADGLAPTNDRESVIDGTLPPGAYTALVIGKDNTSGIGLVEVYDLSQAAAAKLGNLSTRAFVGTGDNIVIAGFILGNNDAPDRIVVRGLGPSLSSLGLSGVLADPVLELRDGNGSLIIANNDWQDNTAQAAEITAAGLAPRDARESAIAAILPPGLYTALLSGVNDGTGVGLVEVYDRGAP